MGFITFLVWSLCNFELLYCPICTTVKIFHDKKTRDILWKARAFNSLGYLICLPIRLTFGIRNYARLVSLYQSFKYVNFWISSDSAKSWPKIKLWPVHEINVKWSSRSHEFQLFAKHFFSIMSVLTILFPQYFHFTQK